jgi:hypothetical protein
MHRYSEGILDRVRISLATLNPGFARRVDAFPLVPDVDDNLIGTQKEPELKDRARARGAVLLVPAIWAALDRPSSHSPVPTVIRHCDELRRAAGLLGYGVDRVTHRSTGLESPTGHAGLNPRF